MATSLRDSMATIQRLLLEGRLVETPGLKPSFDGVNAGPLNICTLEDIWEEVENATTKTIFPAAVRSQTL